MGFCHEEKQGEWHEDGRMSGHASSECRVVEGGCEEGEVESEQEDAKVARRIATIG